jgi:hypothetical protein
MSASLSGLRLIALECCIAMSRAGGVRSGRLGAPVHLKGLIQRFLTWPHETSQIGPFRSRWSD